MRFATFALAAMLAAPGIAAAQVSPLGLMLAIRACQQIKDDRMRLTCFDTMLEDAAAPEGEKTIGKWRIYERKDPIDDTVSHTAAIANEGPRGTDAHFLFRCGGGQFNVWFSFRGEYFADDVREVIYRTDDNEPLTTIMFRSSGNGAYGIWDHAEAKIFLATTIGNSRLAVRIKESNGTRTDAVFDLTGMEAAFHEIKGGCME